MVLLVEGAKRGASGAVGPLGSRGRGGGGGPCLRAAREEGEKVGLGCTTPIWCNRAEKSPGAASGSISLGDAGVVEMC